MTEALSLLRKSIIEKVPYQLSNSEHVKVENIKEATYVTIYDVEYNLSDPSKYKTYNLGTVLFLVKNKNLDHSLYFQLCLTENIQAVSIIDKKGILDYLTGVRDKLDIDGKENEEKSSETREKRVSEKEKENANSKKQKIDDSSEDINVVKQITSRERVLQNRKTILQCRGSKTFEFAHKLASDIFLSNSKLNQKSKDPKLQGLNSKTPSHLIRGHSKPYEKRTPIIIIPSAPTSLLTMYNAKKFFQDQQFIESQECRRNGIRKEPRITITRQRPDGKGILKYYIVDSVEKFSPQDWDRVIAVFTSGATWQFKGWKWTNPMEIFKYVRGFYLQYQDDILKEPVKEWNVKVLKVAKYKRHHDIQTVLEFWNELDKYMSTRP